MSQVELDQWSHFLNYKWSHCLQLIYLQLTTFYSNAKSKISELKFVSRMKLLIPDIQFFFFTK